MKKLLFCLLLLTAISFHVHAKLPKPQDTANKKEVYVYLCYSKTAYVYHSTQNCRGLSHCTHGVIKVTVSDAINKYGRKACKICE